MIHNDYHGLQGLLSYTSKIWWSYRNWNRDKFIHQILILPGKRQTYYEPGEDPDLDIISVTDFNRKVIELTEEEKGDIKQIIFNNLD